LYKLDSEKLEEKELRKKLDVITFSADNPSNPFAVHNADDPEVQTRVIIHETEGKWLAPPIEHVRRNPDIGKACPADEVYQHGVVGVFNRWQRTHTIEMVRAIFDITMKMARQYKQVA